MGRSTQILKFCLTLAHLVAGILWVGSAVVVDRLTGRPWGGGLSRRAQVLWSRGLCRIIAVQVLSEGDDDDSTEPCLLAANHVSWLDILCLATVRPICFLSKAEVRQWPFIGSIAAGLGTLFIRRGARDAARSAVSDMARRLRGGHSVLFFPEGTTTAGDRVLPFRARLFQAASEAAVPVQPVALMYSEDGRPSRTAPFVGEETLVGNLWRLCGSAGVEMRQVFLAPIDSDGKGRSTLAATSRRRVVETLERLRHDALARSTLEASACSATDSQRRQGGRIVRVENQ